MTPWRGCCYVTVAFVDETGFVTIRRKTVLVIGFMSKPPVLSLGLVLGYEP